MPRELSSFKIEKKKKRRYCNFTTSDYKGTFLQDCRIPPWKIILFVNHWLSKHWDHATRVKCLKISTKTSVDWRSFCSEVTDFWFSEQEAIGGANVIVKIDDTLVVHAKYNKGRPLSQIWLFGGIERHSKKNLLFHWWDLSVKRGIEGLSSQLY